MPPDAPKLHRRTYVIDRGFQLKYVVALALVGAGVSALFGTMMYLAHVGSLRSLPVPPALLQLGSTGEATLIGLTVGMAVLMAAALALFGLLITHRVAGPVYVMSHYVSVLAKGRFPLMRPLRKTDELRAFFERFQGALESMRVREASEADTLERAVALFRTLSTSPETEASLAAIEAMCQRKRDATDRLPVSS